MVYYENETKQKMSNSYRDMTPVERSIADFFLSNAEKMDFSSKNISKRLYVSEAALSRFAKKCGYKGYRELIFSYEKDLESEVPKENTEQDVSSFTKKIRGSYASLLNDEFQFAEGEADPEGDSHVRYGKEDLCVRDGKLRFCCKRIPAALHADRTYRGSVH